jgi:hypothetical protein
MAGQHVGTLRERPLHADLKARYAQAGDLVEQPVAGFVVDIVRGDLLIEIQTRGFSSMRRKLNELLPDHRILIVHPIAVDLYIARVDVATGVVSRRRSPKHGQVIDVFAELVAFPELVAHPNFSLEVVLARTEQLRTYDGNRGWRRKGWIIEENRLLEVTDTRLIAAPEDLAAMLPASLPARFTTAEIAAATRASRRLAQQMAYCLRRTGQVEVVGKRGRALEYMRVGAAGDVRRPSGAN